MAEKVVSPRHLFYSAVFGHVVILVIASLMFKFVSEGKQIGPMIIFGIIFIFTALLTVFHINRQVYIRILDDEIVDYGTLFKQAVVPLKSIKDLKRIWFNTYKLKIEGKTHIFYGFRNDVAYFKELIKGAE